MIANVQYNCGGAQSTRDSRSDPCSNLQSYCLDPPGPNLALRCAKYWFLGQHKIDNAASDDANARPATAQDDQIANGLILENGTKYHLNGLDEDAILDAV